MITIHANAVCRVRDGYSGQPLEPSALFCTLDGRPCRPVGKPGGYLVLIDLTDGPHRLSLRAYGFQEEWVEFTANAGTQELDVTMKPGAGYPFRREMIRLELTVLEGGTPAIGRRLWLAAPGQPELKIAQTKAEAGSQELRIYRKGPEALALPDTYLIADGADSEIVTLRALDEEKGTLSAPLGRSHSRGKLLLPAQSYHTGADSTLTAAFRQCCTVEVCGEEGGLVASLELTKGDNRHTIQL